MSTGEKITLGALLVGPGLAIGFFGFVVGAAQAIFWLTARGYDWLLAPIAVILGAVMVAAGLKTWRPR